MTLDDDARDLLIHSRIESAVRCCRGMARRDALSALKACALQGDPKFNHMIEAIMTNMDLTVEDLADRIQAVIELDEEEQAERERAAIRSAIMAEEGA